MCKGGRGGRAVYMGNIPCHVGAHWGRVSWGHAGCTYPPPLHKQTAKKYKTRVCLLIQGCLNI